MLRRRLVSNLLPVTSASATAASFAAPLAKTAHRAGTSQLSTMPHSTTRKPRGKHRGPGKRGVSPSEADWWRYVKSWELQVNLDWEPHERFQHLPKPKRLLGNEACEIVWPYAVLLENVIKIHPFTKSLYVYYPMTPLTPEGAEAARLAKRFARECLVPICFHNSQCYVETEMLLEHGDTAWVVVHCLDGRHEIVRVGDFDSSNDNNNNNNNNINNNGKTEDEKKLQLLDQVLQVAGKLGTSAESPAELTMALNERPLQNGFIRIDYQWMGETPEERQSHLVQWTDPDDRGTQPMLYDRENNIADWLNAEDGRALSPAMFSHGKRQSSSRMQGDGGARGNRSNSLAGYFDRYSRMSPMWGKAAGRGVK